MRPNKIRQPSKYMSLSNLLDIQDNYYRSTKTKGRDIIEYDPCQVDRLINIKTSKIGSDLLKSTEKAFNQLQDCSDLVPKMGNKVFPPIIKIDRFELKTALINLTTIEPVWLF